MTHFKAMTYLLVLLLAFNSLFTGCTVSGYAIGEQADIKNAKKLDNVTLEQIRAGDTVELYLLNNSKIRGRVETVEPGRHIVLFDLDPKLKDMGNKEPKTFKLDEITEIQKVKVRKWYRVLGTALGLAIDVSIPILILLASGGAMGIQ